jgi:hypothetical protein
MLNLIWNFDYGIVRQSLLVNQWESLLHLSGISDSLLAEAGKRLCLWMAKEFEAIIGF